MDLKQWHDFFGAMVGAAAALTGLIFVGVSINISKILSFPKLPDRALLSLILLLNILVTSALMLIPAQKYFVLGIEVLAVSISVYSFATITDMSIYKNMDKQYRRQYRISMFFNQLSLLPYAVAAIVIFFSREKAVYWLIPGVIISFIKAVVDAWILLVEINR
jgi:hypothetical protein